MSVYSYVKTPPGSAVLVLLLTDLGTEGLDFAFPLQSDLVGFSLELERKCIW